MPVYMAGMHGHLVRIKWKGEGLTGVGNTLLLNYLSVEVAKNPDSEAPEKVDERELHRVLNQVHANHGSRHDRVHGEAHEEGRCQRER